MYIKVEFSCYTPWGGARDTMDYLNAQGITGEELEGILEEIFTGDYPTDTQVNDLLWFEPETIYELLGIPNPDDEEDEEEEEEVYGLES